MNKYILLAMGTSALTVSTITSAVEFKLSGQVSRMVVAPSDALGDEIQFQDIGWSGTRFRFTGTQDLYSGMKFGFRIEQQLQSNPAFLSTGGDQTNGGNDDFIDNRYQDIWVSGGFGKLALGKGDGASNGSTEADLSGTALSSSSNHQDNWGSYFVSPDVTWGSIFRMNDGLSRVNRLRYDTPTFSGLSAAVSIGQGSSSEVALKYKGDVAGIKIDARTFYADASDFADDAEIFGVSASALHSSGLNLTAAYSDRDNGTAPDQDAYTVKLGYKLGIHAITIDIGDGTTGNVDADTLGFTYAATPAEGLEVFATIRQLDADFAGASSVDLLALGSRVKF